jgi:hypothetical protein
VFAPSLPGFSGGCAGLSGGTLSPEQPALVKNGKDGLTSKAISSFARGQFHQVRPGIKLYGPPERKAAIWSSLFASNSGVEAIKDAVALPFKRLWLR